jgi:hypothetical protein
MGGDCDDERWLAGRRTCGTRSPGRSISRDPENHDSFFVELHARVAPSHDWLRGTAVDDVRGGLRGAGWQAGSKVPRLSVLRRRRRRRRKRAPGRAAPCARALEGVASESARARGGRALCREPLPRVRVLPLSPSPLPCARALTRRPGSGGRRHAGVTQADPPVT